jgi:hypothetical protein
MATRRMNYQKKLSILSNIQIHLKTRQSNVFFGNAVGGGGSWGEGNGGGCPERNELLPRVLFFLFFYYSQTLVALKTLMRLLKFIVCSLAKHMKWKYISRTRIE